MITNINILDTIEINLNNSINNFTTQQECFRLILEISINIQTSPQIKEHME